MFIAVLLFVWTAAPALRCLVPGASLTAQEQACCKAMGGQCGDSPASNHPCCKRSTSAVQPALVSSRIVVASSPAITVSVPILVSALSESEPGPNWLFDSSPPPDRDQASPVLRI